MGRKGPTCIHSAVDEVRAASRQRHEVYCDARLDHAVGESGMDGQGKVEEQEAWCRDLEGRIRT